MNAYRLSFDENYVVQSLDRQLKVKSGRTLFIALKIICALGLSALLVLTIVAALQSPAKAAVGLLVALVPAFFLFLLALGPRIDYWLMKRRLKRSPFYGNELLVRVAESGVSLTSPKFKIDYTWSAFSKSHPFPDGMLLAMGPSVFQWLPSGALTSGSAADVATLVGRHVAA